MPHREKIIWSIQLTECASWPVRFAHILAPISSQIRAQTHLLTASFDILRSRKISNQKRRIAGLSIISELAPSLMSGSPAASGSSLAGSVLQCGPGRRWLVSDRLLGSGGFARVYECTAASGSAERAAAKVVDLRVQSLWAQGKLRSEADTLRAAQGCDYIVRFIGELRHGPFQIFMLEAWGEADLLEEVLKRQGRGLGEARARIVLVQLLEALAWLHARRICHGCAALKNAPLVQP